MAVTSPEFFALLAVTIALLAAAPAAMRKWILIAASLIFYSGAGLASVATVGLLIIINFAILQAILRASNNEVVGGRWYLASILVNAAVFVFYKLAFEPSPGESSNTWNALGVTIGYPLGLSFVVLMLHGALTDAYSGKYRPTGGFSNFVLFGGFFPYITAGPVERLERMEPQFATLKRPGWDDLTEGVTLIALGLVKKFVVANRLQLHVTRVFDNSAFYSSPTLAFAIALNAAHVYCDFSAYTDIVRGAARCLGIRIEINFDRPFSALSVTEFWRRWHISFSSWLRDYLYMPLAFVLRRQGAAGNAVALLVTFLLCGFWHRASWTFALFGLLHGAAMIAEIRLAPALAASRRWYPALFRTVVARTYTLVFLAGTIVLFSVATLGEAGQLFARLVHDSPVPRPGEFFANRGPVLFAAMVGALLAWQLLEAWHRRLTPGSRPWFVLSAAIVLLLGSTLGEGFIYAQF